MEQANQRPGRHFTPQQKYGIIKDIGRYATIREGLDKHRMASSVYIQVETPAIRRHQREP